MKLLTTHKKLKIAVLSVLVLVVAFIAFMFSSFSPHPLLLSYNPSKVPLITANPVEASGVYQISYFRSDSGHDFSNNAWDGESCRSMKNYINWSQYQVNGKPVRSKPTAGNPNINVYAPFDGKIVADEAEDTPIGRQIHIASAKNPAFQVVLFHIDLNSSLHVGSKVTSGQQIGTIGPMDGMDIAYEAQLWNFKTVYMSVFSYMTPQAFAPYAALGYKSSDFVLTRAQADAKHYQCNGEQFVRSASFLSDLTKAQTEGYVILRPNPYAYLWQNNGSSGQGHETTGTPVQVQNSSIGNVH